MLNLPVVNGVHIKSWCNELEKGAGTTGVWKEFIRMGVK